MDALADAGKGNHRDAMTLIAMRTIAVVPTLPWSGFRSRAIFASNFSSSGVNRIPLRVPVACVMFPKIHIGTYAVKHKDSRK